LRFIQFDVAFKFHNRDGHIVLIVLSH